jgi:hypothetical protein
MLCIIHLRDTKPMQGHLSELSWQGHSAQVFDAWGLLLRSASELQSVEGFRYDLVDVGRQVISKRATDIWKAVAEAFVTGRSIVVRREGVRLMQLLDDLEELLATNRFAGVGFQGSNVGKNPKNNQIKP